MQIVKSYPFGKSNGKVAISSIALSIITCLSFAPHLFFYSISASIYLVLIAVLTVVYIVSKPINVANRNIIVLMIVCAIYMFISFGRSQKLSGSLVDVSVLFMGMLIVIFHSGDVYGYRGVIKCIGFFSMFFAIGVILNSLTPSFFRTILSIFPSSYSTIVRQQMQRFVTGFSTNPGFSAGYIAGGIIVIAAACQNNKDELKRRIVPLIILAFGLMLTGKRGPAIFLLLTIVLCYLIPMRGAKKARRYWRIFIIVLLLVVLFRVFYEVLVTIPVVNEIANTISGLLVGDDVTSGRSRLYVWAIQLFLQNPLVGIGWGDYKTTVVGNATLVKELDVHNIYLQLLCETGIVGFVIIVGTFILMWNISRKLYRQCFNSSDYNIRSMLPFIYFSFAYQTYFLLEGFASNTLYDQNYQVIYMISCAITMSVQYRYAGIKSGYTKGINS